MFLSIYEGVRLIVFVVAVRWDPIHKIQNLENCTAPFELDKSDKCDCFDNLNNKFGHFYAKLNKNCPIWAFMYFYS